MNDAWLPSEMTRRYLLEIRNGGAKPPDFTTTTPRLLSQPGVTHMVDPLSRHPALRLPSGVRVDAIRPVITPDTVSMDYEGLLQLIVCFCSLLISPLLEAPMVSRCTRYDRSPDNPPRTD